MSTNLSAATIAAMEKALETVPIAYPGAGGAIAVVREGEVLARHSWGWADLERRLPFTPQTLFRVCSISKQFTCATMLSHFPDPTVLDADVRARMPLLEGAPGALQLAHNQSGLRDYWATAMLCGSPVEAPFEEAQADHLIRMTRSLHFEPGTRYSYCNQNFRMLGDIVAARGGRDYGALIRSTIFDLAGMPTALLCADTSAMPDGTVGYEGDQETGFRPAVNRIHWTGDAGIGASLEDMIAWEKFIDRTRDDAESVYQRMSAPVHFKDGTQASYGFGLSRMKLLGRKATGHGGGLRGWRSFRFYVPEERLSIVVLFNHMADARAAALDVLATLIEGEARPASALPSGWTGAYQEPESGLVVRLESGRKHQIKLYYSGYTAELLELQPDGTIGAGHTRLRQGADGMWMDREGENQSTRLVPVLGDAARDIDGSFRSAEYGAEFTVQSRGGAIYGAFTGFLGEGTMEMLLPVGPDLWRTPMPRALDHSPPGDWTLQFLRDDKDSVVGVRVGCWLARRVDFVRQG
jgi:D-aminopeptidase